MAKFYVVLVGMAVLFGACSDSDEAPPDTAPENVGGALGGDPPAETRLPGEYVPPSASKDATERFPGALAEDQLRARFAGEINGFQFVPMGADGSIEGYAPQCEVRETEAASDVRFGFLPAGTATLQPQVRGRCPDGGIAWITQQFDYKYGSFNVTVDYGPRIVLSQASADRVEEIEVAGSKGALVHPVLEEGNGFSSIVFDGGEGFVIIEATGLPSDVLLQIAEGVTCEC